MDTLAAVRPAEAGTPAQVYLAAGHLTEGGTLAQVYPAAAEPAGWLHPEDQTTGWVPVAVVDHLEVPAVRLVLVQTGEDTRNQVVRRVADPRIRAVQPVALPRSRAVARSS